MTEELSTTISGTVEKIIEATASGEPEKAQIAVAAPNETPREIRIANTLTKENGDEVGLLKGAEVKVIIEAYNPKASL